MEEKLAIDIFIKYYTDDLTAFKKALTKGKMVMMKDIHLDERFNPKRYVRYYLTFKVLQMPEQKPLPSFNIVQKRLERLHNAAISLEILEMELNKINEKDNLFFYFEVGGIYLLEEGKEQSDSSWYILD